MESPPPTSETSSDTSGKKETTKRKKKAQTALGAFAVEPKRENNKKAGKEAFWPSRKDAKPEPKVESGPVISEETGEPGSNEQLQVEEALDIPEIEASEKQYAESKLVQYKLEHAGETDSDEIPELVHFRQRIVEEGMDSDAALAETLAEIAQEPTESDQPGTPETAVQLSSGTRTTEDVPQEFSDAEIKLSEARPGRGEATGGSGKLPFGPLPSNRAIHNPDTGLAVQSQRVEYIDKSNQAGADLAVDIIGYFIGRRHGRKKAEKRLLPVQKKLEKEVNDLQWQLQAKEHTIRDAVRQKQQAGRFAPERPVSAVFMPPGGDRAQEKISEQGLKRAAAPEATQLHGKKPAPEQIGQILIAAEAIEVTALQNDNAGMERTAGKLRPRDVLNQKNIKTLNRAELLAVSDRIIIEGTSLRQIYETHLVGERGLRRLVTEYVRGGNLKKILREEIVEREIDFERDPIMRDSSVSSAYLAPAGTATPALQNLLHKVDANNNTEKEEVAFLKARADYEAKTQVQQQKHRRVVDASFAGAILILVILVAVLVLSRG